MSWSYTAIGKPSAVLEQAKKQLTQYKCTEPEETIKNKVINILECALPQMQGVAVKVEAYGSQSGTTNNLSVKIEPVWGFVE